MKKVAGKIILLGNILAALLLLLSYAAPYISPGKFLLPAFLGLLYPYLLIINFLFLIYWIIRFRKEFLISLLIIVLGWGHLTLLLPIRIFSQNDPPPLNADTFSLMSYNVRTFDKYKWSKSENPRAGIYSIIHENEPGILCLQEFYTAKRNSERESDIHREFSAYPYYSIYYGLKSSPNTGIGIATFSKYPIIKTSRIPFDNTSNLAEYTDLLISGDTVRLFNIHLQSIKFGPRNYSFIDTLSLKYTNKQIAEAKDIGQRLRNAFVARADQSIIIHRYIQNSPYPVIVAGDFNDTPISFAYNKIRRGLNDAFKMSGSGLGNTYAGDLPSYRIDYILHSHEIMSRDFKRLKVRFSDHFPIFTTLYLYDLTTREGNEMP